MFVVKKLFSGNFLKKLHLLPINAFDTSETMSDIDNDNKENIIIDEKEKQNKFYLVSIYESSIDINKCEFDNVINQYIQIPIIHQNFFFIIFDSGIIDQKIVLITSIGLFIYNLEKTKLNLLYHDIFNTKCEPKDILMYLKINEKLNIITVYSNTNLFFLYKFDKNTKKCEKINQINKLCNGFIKNMNIFNIDGNNFFILTIQTQLASKFFFESYIYNINDKNEINEVDVNKLSDDNINELAIKNHIKYLKNLYEKINKNYLDDKINDIRFSLTGKYIFLSRENGMIILKKQIIEKEETADLMIKYEFKYGTKVNKSYLIDYQKINNYHMLIFDNKIKLFEEKNNVLSRIKLKPKENKELLKNSNVLVQDINGNEISLILYNYKNDISFIKVIKEEEKDLPENKIIDNTYQIKVVTRLTNESMFCIDGAVINNKENNTYKVVGICGLQGESRLIKYSNIFNETNLSNKDIDKEINEISLVTDNFKTNYFSNLLLTSNRIKSNLYVLNKSFMITHIREFSSPAIKIYPVLSSPNIYILVLKKGIGQIIFKDINTNPNEFELKNIYECETNDNKNVSILFSYNFVYNGVNYVVVYLSNKHMMCFNIGNLSKVFDIEMDNLPQPSSLGVILIEETKKLGFIFGNYMNNHILTIYYDIENNKFDMEQISETEILDSLEKSFLVPEDILIFKYYVFMTTHTGDFIILKFNDKNIKSCLKIIFNLENITKNQSPLKFAQIEFDQSNNEFNIDFYSFKNAYNLKINIDSKDNNEIQCNYGQLTKYNFSQNKDLALLSFKKIYSDKMNNTNVHFYLQKGVINFSYFHENNDEYGLLNKSNERILNKIIGCPEQVQRNNILIETIYKFPKEEKAIKIINLNEENNELLILTNNSKLYLFNEELKLTFIKNIYDDVKKADLVIKGIKNFIIKEDDNGNECNINIILAFGSIKKEENGIKGVLIIYQYINNDNDDNSDNNLIFKPLKVVYGYPRPILDSAIIKNYIICSVEGALCIKEYNIKNNEFLWKADAQAKIVNYMNKTINLESLNKLCNKYELFTGDIYESFHLIKFSAINPANYETLGADLSLNSLSNIYPINNESHEVFITDKKGIITKFYLKEEIYNINNRVDLKEYISKLYIDNDKVIMLGLLGSLYYGEILDKNNNNDYEKELLKFQKDVFNEVSKINLDKFVEYEEAMIMSEKICNVILVDKLINFCATYYKELSNKISNFSKNIKILKIINDNLILKND